MQSRRLLAVRVPGSTSNLGSGFDAVSAALSIYLDVEAEMTGGAELIWPHDWTLSPGENAIEIALRGALAKLGCPLPGMRFRVRTEIPLKRGLGSSGAAYIAGIRLAEGIAGAGLSAEDSLSLAFSLEGHPENIAASLLGGWTISVVDGNRMRAFRLNHSLNCRFVVAVPEKPVSTAEARAILPPAYSLKDCVFNVQRYGLLVYALREGRQDLLAESTRDRLHQEYRARLVPGADALLERQGLPGPLSSALHSMTVSGSGSTLLAMASDAFDEIGEWMVGVLSRAGTPASYRVLDLDAQGARFVRDNRGLDHAGQ